MMFFRKMRNNSKAIENDNLNKFKDIIDSEYLFLIAIARRTMMHCINYVGIEQVPFYNKSYIEFEQFAMSLKESFDLYMQTGETDYNIRLMDVFNPLDLSQLVRYTYTSHYEDGYKWEGGIQYLIKIFYADCIKDTLKWVVKNFGNESLCNFRNE